MPNTKTRMLSVVLTPTHPLRLEPGEAVHVGVLRVRGQRSRGAYQSRCPYRSARL